MVKQINGNSEILWKNGYSDDDLHFTLLVKLGILRE